MRRIPPYIDCILHYLMETCGQIACTVRTLPIRFTVGTGGMIGGGTGGTIRGATRNPLHGGRNPTQGSIRRTLDFGGVRK